MLIGVAGRRFQTNGRGCSVLAGESCGDAGYIFAPGNEARRREQEARRTTLPDDIRQASPNRRFPLEWSIQVGGDNYLPIALVCLV
jgi:hypothetical protein